MPGGTRSEAADDGGSASDALPHDAPEVRACESCPGTVVLIESGNTDGWLASDVTVTVVE